MFAAGVVDYCFVDQFSRIWCTASTLAVPPSSALLACKLFDEPWGWRKAIGLVMTAVAVAVAMAMAMVAQVPTVTDESRQILSR
jgi:hypothetical protein